MADKDGNKSGGRKKGTPNEDNRITRKLYQDILADRVEDFNECLDKLRESPKDFVNAYLGMMPYALPKLSNVVVKDESDITQNITINYTKQK